MPSLLWMPEDEYRSWQSDQFKKKAEEMAFPAMARKLIDRYVPPPSPPNPPVGPDQWEGPPGGLPPSPVPPAGPTGFTPMQPNQSTPLPDFLGSMGQEIGGFLGKVPEMARMGAPTVPSPMVERVKREGLGGLLGEGEIKLPVEAEHAMQAIPAFGGVGVGATVRKAAGLTADVIRADQVVTLIPDLTTIMEQQSKGTRQLGVANVARMRKGEGIVRTDPTDLILDASRRQLSVINEAAGVMAEAIRAKWNELGKPFQVAEGRVTNGPAAGQAFQDVMAWSPEDAWNLLDPKQAEFVDYFHRAQGSLVRAIEGQGVHIPRRALPEGERYIHRIYTEVNQGGVPTGPRQRVGATQAHQMRRTHETVAELLDAGRIKTMDDPASLFFGYAQELLKRKADKDLLDVLRPLGQSVRERVGEQVIQTAVDAARQKKGAEHLVRIVKLAVKGGTPDGASLRTIRQNFPGIGYELDMALQVGPPKFNQIISSMERDVWTNLKTTPDDFLEALAEVRGMEGEPRAALTQRLGEIPQPPTVSAVTPTITRTPARVPGMEIPSQRPTGTLPASYGELAGTINRMGQVPPHIGPVGAPITYSELSDALSIVAGDEKAALDFITQFYKEAFREGMTDRGSALQAVLMMAQDQLEANARLLRTAKSDYSAALREGSKAHPGAPVEAGHPGGEGKVYQPGLMAAEGVPIGTFQGKRAQVLRQIIFPERMEIPRIGSNGPTGEVDIISGAEFARRMNAALGPQGEQKLSAYLEPIAKLNALVKAGQVVFDLSGPLIQGFPTLLTDPVKWGKAAGLSYASFLNPEVRTAWMARPENFQAVRRFVEAGGKLGSSDFTEALEAGGVLARAAQRAEKIPVIGGRIHPGRAFTTFSDAVKVMTFDALAPMQHSGATEVADFASKLVGGRGIYGPITNPNLRTLGGLVAYAADYTRASLALATDIFKPGVEGDLARRVAVKMVTAYPAVVYMTALGVDAVNGEKRFSDPNNEDFVLSSDSRYFMRVPVGGDVVSFAGIWPALMRTTARSVASAVDGDPGRFAQVWVDFGTSRIGPLAGMAKTQIAGVTFQGEALDTIGKRVGEALKSPAPLTAQSAIEGQGPAAIGAQFVGFGASKKTPAAQRDELLDRYAQEKGAKSWRELSLPEQDALRKAHPDIIQAQDVARVRAATGGRDEWKTYAQFQQEISKNREAIRTEIADLTQQFKANKISGQQYRDAIQQREFEIGRLGKRFQSEGRFKDMPVTTQEYEVWRKRVGFTEAVKTSDRMTVDTAIQSYYSIADQYADRNGFIRDMAGFMRAREQFMLSLPASIRSEVDNYVNRNKDPDLVKAQKLMSQYQAMPHFVIKMDKPQETAIVEIIERIRARERTYPAQSTDKLARALWEEIKRAKTPQAKKVVNMAGVILRNPDYYNPRRRQFWASNPLLQKYYSDVVLE